MVEVGEERPRADHGKVGADEHLLAVGDVAAMKVAMSSLMEGASISIPESEEPAQADGFEILDVVGGVRT